MRQRLQITFRDIPHSQALENAIRKKADKLELFGPDIGYCRVSVGSAQKHKHQGKLYNVRIDLTVPGHEFVVNRDRNENIYIALRDAFEAAARKLREHSRRQREEIKGVIFSKLKRTAWQYMENRPN